LGCLAVVPPFIVAVVRRTTEILRCGQNDALNVVDSG
jgi:hypothetical protein